MIPDTIAPIAESALAATVSAKEMELRRSPKSTNLKSLFCLREMISSDHPRVFWRVWRIGHSVMIQQQKELLIRHFDGTADSYAAVVFGIVPKCGEASVRQPLPGREFDDTGAWGSVGRG